MTEAHYKIGNNDDKFDNNEDKICLLLRRWDLVSHMLDYILDHVLDHLLYHMLDQMIIGLVSTALQLLSFLALALTNK